LFLCSNNNYFLTFLIHSVTTGRQRNKEASLVAPLQQQNMRDFCTLVLLFMLPLPRCLSSSGVSRISSSSFVTKGGGQPLEKEVSAESSAESSDESAAAPLSQHMFDANDTDISSNNVTIKNTDTTAAVRDKDVLIATELRQKGKTSHDSGDFSSAAVSFGTAADLLLQCGSEEDAATCRIHEALCRWKNDEYDECVRVCGTVLRDTDDDNEEEEGPCHRPAFLSAAVRARAHHRRAKGKMSLGDEEGALDDARAAAFLGDGGAVALYGRLMRDRSPPSLFSSSQSSLFPLMGNDSLLSDGSSPSSSSSSSSLVESLLSMGMDSGSSSLLAPNVLNGLLSNDGRSSVPSSLLQSLLRRVESPSTQETICTLAKSLSSDQILSYAETAGITLSRKTAGKLATFCTSLTPKKIGKAVSVSKGAWYVWEILRRLVRVWDKYKTTLVYCLILAWIVRACR